MTRKVIISRIKYCSVLWVLFFALTACAIPLKQRLLSGDVPRYKGRIDPVKIPITPEYKPAEVKFNATTAGLNSERFTEISTRGKYSVHRMRNLLRWNLMVQSLKTGNRTITPYLPIMESRLLSEKNGKTKEVDLTFPAFEEESGEKGAGPREINALIAGWPYSFFTVLSPYPVRSGDILFSAPVRDCLPEHLRDWLSNIMGTQLEIAKADARGAFHTTLLGRNVYKGKKVIAGELKEPVSLIFNNSEALKAELKGYVLLDADTLQPLKGEILLTVPIKDDPLRVYGTFTAQVR